MRHAHVLIAFIVLTIAAPAAPNPLETGWMLDKAASNIRFQSIKNATKVESSSFADFEGQIAPDGSVEVTVYLDSVDTKIDLRNVRMRFLFFETFKFPEAVITARIDPALVQDLARVRRMTLTLPFEMTLHGITQSMTAEVVATVLTDDVVSIASAAPVSVGIGAFGFEENLAKLEEAARVEIVPSATVTFDFLFNRTTGVSDAVLAAATPDPEAAPASRALEAEGDFDLAACVGRFEILSRTGNIHFRVGSATLDPESLPLLESLADIVARCPGLQIEVAGHTDSDGGSLTNQTLSQRRAGAVAEYLVARGLPRERFDVAGYGETRPIAPNDTAANKRRNRRIEFTVLN